MKIAIVGAGAAGLVAANLLDRAHAVTVFEREPIVGGHVRTLGSNVPCPGLGEQRLEAGVLEFDLERFPTVFRLFDRLGIHTSPFSGATTLLRPGRPQLLSPGALQLAQLRPAHGLLAKARALPLAVQQWDFERRTDLPLAELRGRTLDEFIGDRAFDNWVALLVLYAWSVPWKEVPQVAAEMALPMLRSFLGPRTWMRVPGGVFRYMERILDDLRGTVHTNVPLRGIRRRTDGVELTLPDGSQARFDALILATPPDQVLRLLDDPTDGERRRFAGWTGRRVHTLVHRDDGPYERRGALVRTEFDLFEDPPGYNACMDRVAGRPVDQEVHFGLAFGIDREIDPARILHRQEHHVPVYSVQALRHRDEILATSGEKHTWYAGAWLGEGLHEGAVSSAAEVARALGGDAL